jgi:hypothetical protein
MTPSEILRLWQEARASGSQTTRDLALELATIFGRRPIPKQEATK